MNKQVTAVVLAMALFLGAACTRMTPTQQGALSGAAIGAGAGAGIAAISQGNVGVGALIGGGLGALGGALIGHEVERQRSQKHHAPPPPKPAPQVY